MPVRHESDFAGNDISADRAVLAFVQQFEAWLVFLAEAENTGVPDAVAAAETVLRLDAVDADGFDHQRLVAVRHAGHVDLVTGGIPARLGRRLGGVRLPAWAVA